MGFVSKKSLLEKGLPFILTLFIITADQASKRYISENWPVEDSSRGRTVRDVFGNDVLKIVHVRNTVVAFSIGSGVPAKIRPYLFIVLPILILLALLVYYFKSPEWTVPQRWAAAGIFGGGAGNLIDRIFPQGGVDGVVDFISVKFWGIFGFERWPTFNIADASVVVCVIFWFATMILDSTKNTEKIKKSKGRLK